MSGFKPVGHAVICLTVNGEKVCKTIKEWGDYGRTV